MGKRLEKRDRTGSAERVYRKNLHSPKSAACFFDCMKVRRSDSEDAEKILAWNEQGFSVAKSAFGNRMNEYKTHKKWAKKICILRSIYGIKDE